MANRNFYSDNPDIVFHLEKRIDWQELFIWLSDEEKEVIDAKNSQEYKSSWLEVLESLGGICGGSIAENAGVVDRNKYKWDQGKDQIPSPLQDNLKVLKEFGIAAMGVAPKYGGLGCPFFLEVTGAEMINRACPSTMLNVSWYGSIAHIIERFGSETLQDQYIPKIAEGEWSGNMALTEPDAGSDLSALRTYGVKQEDGTWKLNGTKRFISNGTSHVSLVLAKNEKGAKGLDALSLFLCPREIDGKENIKVLKLEDKIGLHGSATAELAYDGSTAWLLGKEGDGFQYMLNLMNDSRIGVGFQGLGLMEACFELAKEYTSQRKSWGKVLAHHEMIAEYLLDQEVELKAIRSLCYQTAYSRTMEYLGERFLKNTSLDATEKRKHEKKLLGYRKKMRKWTPLIKYWVGENSIKHARQTMQLLGGYGYTTEYKAEWYVRESLIYSLYEGTSQIQSLMCIKDTLKEVVRNPKLFIEEVLGMRLKALTGGPSLQKKLYKIKQLSHGATLSILFKLVKTNMKKNFSMVSDKDISRLIKFLSKDLIDFKNISPALLHAEKICEIQCLEAMAETLFLDSQQEEGRSWVAERFMYNALQRINFLKARIEQEDRVIEERLASIPS